MKQAIYLRWIFNLILIGLLTACTREKVVEEIPVPGYGEPTWNPLYALRESLRLDGVQAQSRRDLDLVAMQLQPTDTLVFLGDVRDLADKQERELLEWVRSGGHLLIQAPQWLPVYTHSTILQEFGIDPSQADSRCHSYKNQYLLCRGNRFILHKPEKAELYWTDDHDKTAVWARLPHGAGQVDILGSLDFLNNGFLSGNAWLGRSGSGLHLRAHRAFARQLLTPNYGRGVIHLVFSQNIPSLWKLLWKYGWPAWLPLTLALAGGLWMGSQRFGALLPAPIAQRRSLLEHVRASGYYLYRRRQSNVLYQAVRELFMQRLRQRAPWIAVQSDDEQIHAIARHLRYSPEQVGSALSLPAVGDNATLHKRIALLIDMRNQL